MMKKTITSSGTKAEILKVSEEKTEIKKFAFQKGSKYLFDGIQYTVKNCRSDNGSEFIIVFSEKHGEQMLSLHSLLRDMESPNFSVIYNP
jgi:hypothetical protein